MESPSFSHDVLFKGENNLVLDVRMNEPLILNALQKQNLPIKYPVLIQKGKAVIELLSYRENNALICEFSFFFGIAQHEIIWVVDSCLRYFRHMLTHGSEFRFRF
jgi:hypothetical protein